MANKQVARVDDSWYGSGHTSDEEKDHTNRRTEAPRMSPAPLNPRPGQDIQKAKRFALPMEPTESVDKSREYPPIITVDGRVDTDIDHLMENPEEDTAETPVQEIPSKFPKPHVVRVIDGSLDDDIDNLINHDGTMAHTLVDAPKNFSSRELKEINSSKSSPPPSNSSTKKDNSLANRQSQATRVLSRMNRDGSDEDNGIPTGSGSKVVPYFERNNSSKAPTINNDDADFCHLKESLEEGFVSPPPDLDKINVTFASDQSEYLPVFDRVKEIDDELKSPGDRGQSKINAGSCDENADKSTKSEDMSEAENASDMDKGEITEVCDISRAHSEESPSDSISLIVEQLLKTMSKEELEKRLGIGSDSAATLEGETEVQITKPDESKQNEHKDDDANEMDELNKVSTNSSRTILSDTQKPNRSEESIAPVKTVETPNTPSLQETMSLLKQSLDMISKDSSESSQITESQKMLAVTALKVAGESMTAAAKMADALTLLVQTSQISNSLFKTQSSSFDKALTQSEKKEDAPIVTMSEPAINGKIKLNKERSNVTSEKKDNEKRIKDLDHEPHTQDSDHSIQEEEADKRRKSDDSEKSKTNKEKKESESKGNDSKSKKQREHDEKCLKEPESKSRSEVKKGSSDRKRRDSKQSDLKEDHHRKRSTRKTEEILVIDDESSLQKERFQGNPKSYNHREEGDRKAWDYTQKRQRSRENPEDCEYEFFNDAWTESDYVKERNLHEMDGRKRRDKKRGGREEHHKKSRSSPQHRSKCTPEIPAFKAPQNINESHSPKSYTFDPHSAKKTSRNVREGRDDEFCRKSTISKKHSGVSQADDDVFVRSDPWTLPNGEQHSLPAESYFDQVVRQLKPFSPTRNSNCVADPQRDYFRAKLVGSCVDPHARDSDFDSIEFNANARPSESTRVHFDDEEEWHYCEEIGTTK